MTTLRLVLGDQLSHSLSALDGFDVERDLVLIAEVRAECTYVKHHKKKIAFVLSAMRHFAVELRQKKYQVIYTKFDDPQNSHSIISEIKRLLLIHKIQKVVVTEPSEYRLTQELITLQQEISIPFEIREDQRFLASHQEFAAWARNRKELRLEFFYRQMRLKYEILINDNKPIGGKWNFDTENRNFPKQKILPHQSCQVDPDQITKEVMQLVAKNFSDHFGDLEPFYFAVTRPGALEALKIFIEQRLKFFGDYQDVMITGQPWLFHSHLSFYLNVGLLQPLECIKAAEAAYFQGLAPINAVEGFIRQILGWREYVRGIYWLKMPDYKSLNFFKAEKELPEFYWHGQTKMNCLSQCILETKKNAYAHHIQRLMVLGNFALLVGINPDLVNEWYLIVYADAFEWVELPNVSGMILFADGGILGSKPYAAGGAYINKMSDYCRGCSYKVEEKHGEEACPFNYLYWNFLAENRDKLKNNQRLKLVYSALDKMVPEKIKLIREDAKAFLAKLN